MKRLFIAAAVLGALLAANVAHAEQDFVQNGKIQVGSPTTYLDDTATELGPCGFPRNHPNLESAWVTLPDNAGGHDFTLTATGATGIEDIDVYFLDAGCNFLDYTNHELGFDDDTNESGSVPASAAYADIDLASGAQASYTLTVKAVLPDA